MDFRVEPVVLQLLLCQADEHDQDHHVDQLDKAVTDLERHQLVELRPARYDVEQVDIVKDQYETECEWHEPVEC